MNLLRVIIVEDEAKGREMLRKLVELYCPEVTIAGVAESVATGVALINEQRPDIVLMDIELQPGTCFDIFPQLEKLDFEIIFTTAYKDYAIEAIKHSAIDYLLKPINKNELKLAIYKAIEKRSSKEENSKLQKLLREHKSSALSKLGLPTIDGVIFAEIEQIIRCEAKGSYTTIFFKDKTKHITSKMLKEYETALQEHHFFRVHNSHLINLAEVKKYIKSDGGFVEMKDGSQVPISQSHKDGFLDQMKKLQ